MNKNFLRIINLIEELGSEKKTPITIQQYQDIIKGIGRTMKPWEVNVKPKTSTLVSQRTSQKPKGTRLWQSLRRLWNLIRAIAEIQNQTTRYLRALCRK